MVELPLPNEGEEKEFDLEVSLEIPAHVFADHDPWSRLQVLARLGSPNDPGVDGMEGMGGSDAIRRAALAAAHRAKVTRRKLLKATVKKSRLLETDEEWTLAGRELRLQVEEALAALRLARDTLGRQSEGEPDDISTERRLATEFLSNHVIELISRTQRSIDQLGASPKLAPKEKIDKLLKELRPALTRGLAEEFSFRRSVGFPSPRPVDPAELERFVSRAGSLKKHFQEILFLRLDSQQAGSRFRYAVSATAAILAALFVIPITAITTGSHGLKGLGLGLSSSFFIAILAYGVRERIKEGVRGWLTARAAKVGRRTVFTTPPRPPVPPVRVGTVRETFSTSATEDRDPAHPDLRSFVPVIRLRYQMQGEMDGEGRLAVLGSRRVKIVFRYDLSPIFSRLHDPLEEVLVLDESEEQLLFTDAPRLYRIPVEAKIRYGSESQEVRGTLLAQKFGLVRIEPEKENIVARIEERAASIPVGMMRRR